MIRSPRETVNVVGVLVCRRGSTRLPDKVMKPIEGKPLIERMVDRVRRSNRLADLVLATTDREEDTVLADLAARVGIHCFRGSSEDVLARINGAAAAASADAVAMLLGDNPLIHSDLIDDVVDFFESATFDYVSNVTAEHRLADPGARPFPLGLRVEVVRTETLERANRDVRDNYHREHASSYIREHTDLFQVGYFDAAGRWGGLHRPDLNFSVNTEKNFSLVSHLFREGLQRSENFSLHDVMTCCSAEPQLTQLMGA